MKIKNFLVFSILFLFCVFVFFGCGDEGIENVLYDLGAAPAAQGTVTEVPPEIQEICWGKDVDTLMAELENAIDRDDEGRFIDEEGRTVRDPTGVRAKSLIHQICLRREREAYYTKYINAGGVAIMGNGHVADRLFYAARDIVLGMTSKRPELRAVLTPSYENRPGATQLDTRHDVTGRWTPSRRFRMILVHTDMDYTSIPESHLGNGTVNFHAATGIGGAYWPSLAWLQVGGYRHTETIRIYPLFSHEFAHALEHAIELLDPTFHERLKATYANSVENKTPTASDYSEYWAESVTRWFGFTGPDQFRERDPLRYALLAEWFDLIDLTVVGSQVYE